MPLCGEAETRCEQPSRDSPTDSNFHHLQSIMSSCFPITLTFMDVRYEVKIDKGNTTRGGGCGIGNMFKFSAGPKTLSTSDQTSTATDQECCTILDGITGMVTPGEILGILGPSGSGKSTLLNALAGRLQTCLTGSVLANGRKLTKPVMKRTGFVSQDDVGYPHLTVRETLVFCSLLRLPKSLSKKEKVAVAESVIYELGLQKCENTIVGNSLIRGVSGGERRRVSIAHELLINPSLLILDEPTSGLDSTAAYRIMSTLRLLAGKGKTVVASVHQPSSRVYQMFDSVLVLAEGRCIYFGKATEAMGYFESSVGFSPSFPMNPADFLLDLANGVCQLDVASEREKPNVKQLLVSSYNSILAPNVKTVCLDITSTSPKEMTMGNQAFKVSRKLRTITCYTWFNQFSILLQRNLRERRHETFNSLKVFQVMAASLLAGTMWWHSDFTDIQDRLGLLFFFSIFWGVFPSFNAVFAFSQDRAIFSKERASGMYTLSSYFMARIVGDLPMELILPTLFLTIAYWMTGLRPQIEAFVLTLLVILGYVVVSQGLGLAVGALIMDAKQGATLVTVIMLAFVLTGGFYVHKVPDSLAWVKYISTTFYSYTLLINVQYGGGQGISSFFGCSHYGINKASCKFIENDIQGKIHPGISVGILVIMFVVYRVLAYVALRRIRA